MSLAPPIRCCLAALCSAGWLLVFVPIVSAAPADEVQWRNDYQKARQEAAVKGRPLILDFYTDSCFWCKQLDSRTFRDPAIIALLNEQCVPLKVDANRNPTLAEALQINVYPTIVFAGSDGRILGYQEGFAEPPKMKELIQKAIGAVATPEWMTRDYRDASKAAAASDFAKAISLLKNLIEDGKDRPVQAKGRILLADLEKQAATRFLRGKTLVEVGKSDEGREAILEVVRLFPGTPAASDADRYLARLTSRGGDGPERERLAREAMAQAREEYRSQQFAMCLDRCETIAALYPDLPEALQATQLAGSIKDNPEWLKQAVEQQGDRLAQLYLAMAETWLRKGQPQQAVFYLERVQQLFPNSRHAEAASVRLAQVQGLPMKKQ